MKYLFSKELKGLLKSKQVYTNGSHFLFGIAQTGTACSLAKISSISKY
jgi:hypothetical protein